MSKEHNHNEYVSHIRQRAEKARSGHEQRKALFAKARQFVSVSSKSPEKGTSPNPTANAREPPATPQQPFQRSESVGQLSPSSTPANDYLSQKKEASLQYQYGSQRQKIRAPYHTR